MSADGPSMSPRTIHKTSPVTGEDLGEFPIADAEAVAAAVARARAAAAIWREVPLAERLDRLEGVRRILLERGEEFARRIADDTGKPKIEALITEILFAALFLDYHRKVAPKVLRRRKVSTPIVLAGKTSYLHPFPRGVIGVISPWNFPFQLSVVPILTALTAGNTVVLKPSEVTPITGEVIRELFAAIDLPVGAVEVVQGDGSTGAALVAADIDMVFFTGSVATGRKVMAAAAAKPIPCELELGGKDAMIVCADAPLERAAKAAVWGGFTNCGQACVSVERLFVVREVHDRFVEMVREEAAKLRIGGPDEDADVGPMIFSGQLAIVERHVREALAAGARLLGGGQRVDRAGQFYAPTILGGVTPEMSVYREETFGPVLPIIAVDDEEEAIRLANAHEYGLNASVWTRDLDRGLAIAGRLECGQVTVNDVLSSAGHPALPFGGVRSSGIGRYHGEAGLLSFSNMRGILCDRAIFKEEPIWYPYAGKFPSALQLLRGVAGHRPLDIARAFLGLRKAQKG